MKWLLGWGILSAVLLGGAASYESFNEVFSGGGGGIWAIQSQTAAQEQTDAVIGLIKRILPTKWSYFNVTIDSDVGPANRDTYTLETVGDQLSIVGSSGVAAASGFNAYLKQYCGCSIYWSGKQLKLPAYFPNVSEKLKVVSNDKFHYYSNVCTYSYSYIWWNQTQWERHIDWMAMNGINLPLSFNGQEDIWIKTYTSLGLTEVEVRDWISGPAFLAWWRMGNMDSFGGPLPKSWPESQATLQRWILKRVRAFGMTPILPAFAGHVPQALERIYPNASFSQLSSWSHFNCSMSCTYFLSPMDPLFLKVGSTFVKLISEAYGTDHLYNTDPFNEVIPKSGEPEYMANVSRAVYQSIKLGDPRGVWVLQGWMFVSESYWTEDRAKAFLTAVPKGDMLVLDLQSELRPQYQRLQSYYGQSFIWCFLHNFGGVIGMYGSLDWLNGGLMNVRETTSMIGTGLTMEGINQNEVMYEFMNEQKWVQPGSTDMESWLRQYSTRRYGFSSVDTVVGWELLRLSVYSMRGLVMQHQGGFVVVNRPEMQMKTADTYPKPILYKAWSVFAGVAEANVSQAGDSHLFAHDLVDVTRESLVSLFADLHSCSVTMFNKPDEASYHNISEAMLALLDDLDMLLLSDPTGTFLLGRWVEGARSWGQGQAEGDKLEFNARNQITLWGPTGQILDYATKQWAGVVSGYMKRRWMIFFDYAYAAVLRGKGFPSTQYGNDVFLNAERPFSYETSPQPTEPVGDAVKLSIQIFHKYSVLLSKADVCSGWDQ